MATDIKKEQEREELHRSIWNIANDLRGSVDGWDFKQYVLGMLFYSYISENLTNFVNNNEIDSGNEDFDYAKLSDEEATIAIVDANVQREEILPSERAFSLKMKMEALNSRQGKRTDLTCGNDCHKLEEAGTKSRAIVGKDAGMSERSVQNYIKLTELVPEVWILWTRRKSV